MKRTPQILSMFAIAVFVLCLPGKSSMAGNALAQEKAPPALPTPEMKRLAAFYAGTWDYTETYPKSASVPNGGVNTGVYTSELGPGGNSIFNHFHSRGPVGEFEGTLVMTWDAKEKAYKAYLFAAEFPGSVIETGQWEGDSLVYRLDFSSGQMKFALRNVAKLTAPGKMVSDEFSSANGAPEALVVHVEAIKRP